MQRSFVRSLLGASSALALASLAAAQAPAPFVISTTNDVPPTSTEPAVDDADLFLVADGAVPGPYLLGGHWDAVQAWIPGDVDALGWRPGAPSGAASAFAFSLLSNEAGFEDGDVLGFAPGGGVEVLVPEVALANGLGAPGASLDVDALDFDDQGRLVFSFQSDVASTAIGQVLDGDVLRLESNGVVSRLYSEADVQAFFTLATGLSSAIGDVQGLDWESDALYVAVQSPSSHDGGVLRCSAAPAFLLDEAVAGLGGQELDAVARVTPTTLLPRVSIEPRESPPDTPVEATFRGTPNSLQLVLASGASGYVPSPAFPGFGAWYLDPGDPWIQLIRSTRPLPFARIEASGSVTRTFQLPAVLSGPGILGADGWSFQTLEFPSLRMSAPFRVTRL